MRVTVLNRRFAWVCMTCIEFSMWDYIRVVAGDAIVALLGGRFHCINSWMTGLCHPVAYGATKFGISRFGTFSNQQSVMGLAGLIWSKRCYTTAGLVCMNIGEHLWYLLCYTYSAQLGPF